MKKFFVIILCLFLLTACNKEETKEKIIYNNYIKTLNNNFKTTNNIPFDIEIYLDKISNTEVMYRAIIDNPKTSIKNIEVLIIHDKYTKDIYPSSGIFDEKYSLIPNTIEKSNNIVKGIILIGYIPYEGDLGNIDVEFKLYLKYTDDDSNVHEVMYSTKKYKKAF